MSELPLVEWRLKPAGIQFEVATQLGARPDSAFPLGDGCPPAASSSIRQLEALWIEGRVLEEEGRFLLPWKEFYQLEDGERQALALNLVPADDLAIELRSGGAIRDVGFGLRPKVVHPRLGILPEATREGPAFLTEGAVLLAPENALPLFEVVDRAVPSNLSGRLLLIGEGRKAALRCGARLDPFLENENILVPDAVGLEVDVVSPDEVHLRPRLEGEGMDEFSSFQRERGRTRTAYTRRDGSQRTRVVLGTDEREASDEIRRRSTIRGADVPRFFTNPEAFVPESIDLSLFSRRVRGLVPRKYTSQPYLRAEAGGRDWFTVSARVELAGELTELGPSSPPSIEPDVAVADAEPSYSGERRGGGSEDVPAISPEEYADLCQEVIDSGERYVLHQDAWIEIDPKTAEQYLRTWELVERDEAGEMILPRAKAQYVLDVISNLEELVYQEGRELGDGDGTFLSRVPDYEAPARLRADLMPHQVVGYRWLRYLLDSGLGGLLADDMGLGKTIQVISFLAHLADEDLLSPTLIVLPSALVENWRREIRKFCPSIHRVYQHIGSGREKDPGRIATAEVVLTTYQTLLRDQLILGQVDWRAVVSDEAQYVKNPTAQSTAVLKAMKADLRLALTGTPVENGLSELWCIVDFVQPGRLGSQREFREDFERPIRDAIDDDSRVAIAQRLQDRLVPHYVRRVKEDILKALPGKAEERHVVPMGPRQRDYYGAVIRELRDGRMIAIAALQRLIQICSHPELFRSTGAPPGDLVAECPKLERTLQLIEAIVARGEKVLIYTHFKGMQRILQDILEERFQRHVPIINGDTAGARRPDVVERFNGREGFAALILAPQAAGVGLNITGANHVIHYTRLWNPAKENQATDRAHRLGQTRPVTVYYPIVAGEEFVSVEERLAELLEDKRELARNVVWPRSSLDVSGELQTWLSEEPPE